MAGLRTTKRRSVATCTEGKVIVYRECNFARTPENPKDPCLARLRRAAVPQRAAARGSGGREPIVGDVPLGAGPVAKHLRTGEEEHPPAVESTGIAEDRDHLAAVGEQVGVPRLGG